MKRNNLRKKETADLGPVADLMAGVGTMFLLIAIIFWSTKHAEEVNNPRNVAASELSRQFGGKDAEWDMTILQDGTVRFNDPDALFTPGSAELTPLFQEMLDDFFPEYIRTMRSRFGEQVREVRIEGHSSSEWGGEQEINPRYLNNAELSQRRALAVLRYGFENFEWAGEEKEWLIKNLRANGMSFSRPIPSATGGEDRRASRRVEFRILLQSGNQSDG